MDSINLWPILVSTIVAFIIGALWYSPILFGKEWASLMGFTDADMAAGRKKMWVGYVVQFISTLVLFSVLGFLIASSDASSAGDGAFFGFIVWLGFVATETVGQVVWARKPIKLALINSINSLVNLVIGGAIIGAWK